ncbi:MAG TPA: hypothetical protein VF857_11165 [Spirochaetota bacterium]
MALETNQFFDLNKLPTEEGILFFGISMNRIGNAQSAEACFEYLKWIDTKIEKTEGVGMVMWYGDYLYFHSDEPASRLRDRYKDLMLGHKNGFLNIISKDPNWIKKAFSFYTFGQVMLDNAEVFVSAQSKIIDFYQKDELFRKYVEDDCAVAGHGLGEKERMFILEEIIAYYLAAKGKLNFNNRFVPGTEKWVLLGYPGKPLKSEAYLFQKNPLGLSNPQNKFENCFYDVEGRVLYDYTRLDIDTFNFDK